MNSFVEHVFSWAKLVTGDAAPIWGPIASRIQTHLTCLGNMSALEALRIPTEWRPLAERRRSNLGGVGGESGHSVLRCVAATVAVAQPKIMMLVPTTQADFLLPNSAVLLVLEVTGIPDSERQDLK